MRLRRFALTVGCIGGVTLATVAAGADWRETYRAGVEAYETGDLDEAERLLQEARRERPESKSGFRRYFPHYYLGLTLAQRGRCRTAVAAFDESERQGEIRGSRLYTDLQLRRGECEAQLEEVDAALKGVGSVLAQARDDAGAVGRLSRTEELAPGWAVGSPSSAEREEQGSALLLQAEQQVEEARVTGDRAAVEAARGLADRARAELASLAAEAREQLRALNRQTAGVLEELEGLEAEARAAVRSVSDLAPYPPRLGARVEAVERLLDRVVETKGEAQLEQLGDLTGELRGSLEALRRGAERPPPRLAAVVDSFVAGRYAEVLEALEGDLGGGRTGGHACLLRAASRHALYLLSGQSQLARQASGDLADCPQRPPTPDPRFFSPRFVEFFHDQLGSG